MWKGSFGMNTFSTLYSFQVYSSILFPWWSGVETSCDMNCVGPHPVWSSGADGVPWLCFQWVSEVINFYLVDTILLTSILYDDSESNSFVWAAPKQMVLNVIPLQAC